MPQYLQTLIRDTPAATFQESRLVKIVHFDPRTGVTRGLHDGQRTIDVEWKSSGTQTTHVCKVRFFSDRADRQQQVWVWCDCGDFTFRLEYALTQRRSSSIQEARALPPERTNPKMKTRLCKHLLKIIQLLPQIQIRLSQS